MKPYSQDLRQKVVAAYNNNEGSQREIAQRFCVSLSFVQSLLKRYRCSGTVEPRPHGGGQSPKLNPEQTKVLAKIVKENQSLTLTQLCYRLEQATGVRISRATMGRMIYKFDLHNYRKNCKANHQLENKSRVSTEELRYTGGVLEKTSPLAIANSTAVLDRLTA